mgnify:CR=1 FL=1
MFQDGQGVHGSTVLPLTGAEIRPVLHGWPQWDLPYYKCVLPDMFVGASTK